MVYHSKQVSHFSTSESLMKKVAFFVVIKFSIAGVFPPKKIKARRGCT